MTPVEIGISAGIVVVIGVLLFLAVGSQQRQARDTQHLEAVRGLQADLEAYRGQRASYPSTLDALGPASSHVGYTYVATPEGCSEDGATLCLGYTLGFQLEGAIGGLAGGHCTAGPKGIACGK